MDFLLNSTTSPERVAAGKPGKVLCCMFLFAILGVEPAQKPSKVQKMYVLIRRFGFAFTTLTGNLSAKNYRCFRVDHGGNKLIDSVHLSIK